MTQQFWGIGLDAWNVIGTWVSGLASTLAVVTALYLANRTNRHRARLSVSLVQLYLNPEHRLGHYDEAVQFSITNTGERRIVVSTIGWSVGFLKKEFAYQRVDGIMGAVPLPAALEHGETISWVVHLGEMTDPESWIRRFPNLLLRRRHSLLSVKAYASTTVERTFVARPSAGLRNKLRESLSMTSQLP